MLTQVLVCFGEHSCLLLCIPAPMRARCVDVFRTCRQFQVFQLSGEEVFENIDLYIIGIDEEYPEMIVDDIKGNLSTAHRSLDK